MKNTKRVLIATMVVVLGVSTIAFGAGATKSIKALLNGFSIIVDGKNVRSDSIYYNGVVYVPAKTIGQALNVKTVIDTKSKKVAFGESKTTKTVPGKITKAAFDKIKNGMSYEEVTAIIGYEGELISESGEKGDPAHTVMYQYYGSGSLGANANIMFQGDQLVNKAQMGLK